MTGEISVLFVDDDEDIRCAAHQMLDLAGVSVETLANPAAARASISRDFAGVLVTDIRMPGDDGMALMRHALEIDPDLPVILVTGHGDVNLAVDAMREGAYDFIEKPFAAERFLDSIARAREKRQLTLENRALRDTVASRRDNVEARLAGRAPLMLELRDRIRAIAETPSDVLIVGATGTGKEIAARAIHDLGGQSGRAFVTINCAALPQHMIEAELFGYEAGAFPGAQRARFGRLEHGRGGTIFLDKFDAMPIEVQARLVHTVESRTITRLGSHDEIPLNARFIAASNTDLVAEAESGRFRSDLLYRLNVVTLRMPVLAERREDIPLLFTLLAREAAARFRADFIEPDPAFLSSLSTRNWPGNVRELRNAAERYVLGLDSETGSPTGVAGSLVERMNAFERQAITAELRANHGQLKPTYEALGLSRKTLYEKIQKHGIEKKSFRL